MRHRDGHATSRLKHAGEIREHLDRPGEVLDRHGDHSAVERPIPERQSRFGIQIVDNALIQTRVGCQLLGVHAETRHMPIRGVGQMRNP